ncbi:MAG: chain-length determining protein [Brevundimonas sp.]|nr:chain-length determining protein [Brevundimonas sp.]
MPPWAPSWPFLICVILPTLLAAVYFLLIASPRYVSEARFIVRQSGQVQPDALGLTLQGVGLSATQTDAFAVHDYMRSRDAVAELDRSLDLSRMLGPPGADVFSRWPRPWESRSREGLHKGYQRFVTVGYDATTGISILRVEAYRPEDARRLAEALLTGGEDLVNRLNARSVADAVTQAERSRDEARERLSEAQRRLVAFRNRERFIDPSMVAAEGAGLIGELSATLAGLRAERAQLAAEAPQSPQLPSLDNRITAYERQISAERSKLAGAATSLVPAVSAYEDLVRERELADRQLSEATAALLAAERDARRQALYLQRVVNPGLADDAILPRRWRSILIVLIGSLLLYGVGWLVWSGLREHRQQG